MTSRSTPGLTWLNTAEEGAARAALAGVCAARAWGGKLLDGRPYPDAEALLAANDAAMAELGAPDLAEAMAGHPPIGRPAPGDPDSAREQRGMAGAPAELATEMRELNLAYQDRFGHVFLLCATGLTAEQMRDAARERLGNTPEREREIARGELAKINRIRLTRLVHEGARAMATESPGTGPRTASVSTHILDTSVGRPARDVDVGLAVRSGRDGAWAAHAASRTDADGRCTDFPVLPEGTTHARLRFEAEPYFARTAPRTEDGAPGHGGGFFPEVTVSFTVTPGEHHHVPLLLNPFGYSVYRGS